MNAVFKALSDPTRRKVLQLLRQRPMTAGELADHFQVSKPTMSAHFSVLKEADLINATKTGRTITYQLKMSVLEEAMLGFAQVFGLDVKPKDTPPQPQTQSHTQTHTQTHTHNDPNAENQP